MRAPDDRAPPGDLERRGRRLVFLAVALLWLSLALPLALGLETLYYRDVFSIHLHFKAFGAEQLARGRIPAFNSDWGLGQVFRGNPNALPFYPGNLLYLVLPFWIAFNLHFVLHWLLAFVNMRALARGLGQGASGSLVAAVTYAGCGWMLSNLGFYNLLTVAAWWPLTMLGAARGGRKGIALGSLACGLALLGGEPVSAGIAMVPTLSVAVSKSGLRRGVGTAGAILLGGVVIALPQLVATARVFDFTYRGAHGFLSTETGYALSPLRLAELLLPLPFGLPNELGPTGFWATRVGDRPPFFLSLYFGVVGIVLWLAGARRRPWWSLLAALGLILAWLGGLVPGALERVGAGLFRYPEKFVTWFALATPLLVGWGLEEATRGHRRWSRGLLGASAAMLLLAAAVPILGDGVIAWLAPEESQLLPSILRYRMTRWVIGLLAAALFIALAAWAKQRGSVVGLLGLQFLSLIPLHPLVPTDATANYRQPSPWQAMLEKGSGVLMSTYDSPFNLPRPVYYLPDTSRVNMVRLGHLDLDFPTGILHGLTYPLTPELEGLESPLFSLMVRHLPRLDWGQRLNWIRMLGVEAVTLTLDPGVEGLTRIAEAERFQTPTFLFRVETPAPKAWWPREVGVAPSPIVAFAEVTGAEDPVARVVAPKSLAHGPGGKVRVVAEGPDDIELEIESDGGLVVVRRAYHPLLRAFSGGRRLDTFPVNLNLLGIEVPPGRQQVIVRASAGPEILAGLVALVALAVSLRLMLSRGARATRGRRRGHAVRSRGVRQRVRPGSPRISQRSPEPADLPCNGSPDSVCCPETPLKRSTSAAIVR